MLPLIDKLVKQMILPRYLFRQEAMAIVLITLLLTGAIWFSQSLKLLEMVVDGGAPIFVFIELMMLVLPSFLSPIMPIALFLGLLFTMQKFVQDQEWIVMQGAGMSPWQLGRPALLLALVVMFVHLAVSVDLAPAAQRELRLQRRLIQTDYAGALLREGTFNAIGHNMTIYVQERTGSNLLKGVLIHDTRDLKKSVTLTAESGFLVNDKGPTRLIIQRGTRQERNNTTGEVAWLLFDQYVVDLAGLNDVQDDAFIKAYERPIWELFNPTTDVTNAHATNEFLAEAHERLAFPLYNLAFAMIALVAVMGGEFSRRGRPHRYLGAILLVVAMQASALAIANLAAKDNMLIPFMYAPPLLTILAGAAWLTHLKHLRSEARFGAH